MSGKIKSNVHDLVGLLHKVKELLLSMEVKEQCKLVLM